MSQARWRRQRATAISWTVRSSVVVAGACSAMRDSWSKLNSSRLSLVRQTELAEGPSSEASPWRVGALAAERALPSGVTGPWDFFPLARFAALRRLEDITATSLHGRFAAGGYRLG